MSVLTTVSGGCNWSDPEFAVCYDSQLNVYDSLSYKFYTQSAYDYDWTPSQAYTLSGIWVESYYTESMLGDGTYLTCELQENTGSWTTRATSTVTLDSKHVRGHAFVMNFDTPYPVTAVASTWRVQFFTDATYFYLATYSSNNYYLRHAMISTDTVSSISSSDILLVKDSIVVDGDYSSSPIDSFRIGRGGNLSFATHTYSYLRTNDYAYLMSDNYFSTESDPVVSGCCLDVDVYLSLRGDSTMYAYGNKTHNVHRSKLSQTVGASATSCTVDDDTGWKVGDQIFFPSTCGDGQSATYWNYSDYVTITAISGNLIEHDALTYAHYSDGTTYQGDVCLITRNFVIKDSTGQGNIYAECGYSGVHFYNVFLDGVGINQPLDGADSVVDDCAFRFGTASPFLMTNTVLGWNPSLYLKDSTFFNATGVVTVGGVEGFKSENCVYCNYSYESSDTMNWYFGYDTVFDDNVVAGICNTMKVTALGEVTSFDGNEFYSVGQHTDDYCAFYILSSYGFKVTNLKGWLVYYSLFKLNDLESRLDFENCHFANASGTNYGAVTSAAMIYPHVTFYKCYFDGMEGYTTTGYPVKGSFSNLEMNHCYFGTIQSTGSRCVDVYSESRVWINYCTMENKDISTTYLDGKGFVSVVGANGDDDYNITYLAYGAKMRRDTVITYGNSTASIKFNAAKIEAQESMPYRFWIPCIANQLVTVKFRCKKSSTYFTTGHTGKYTQPRFTLGTFGDEPNYIVTASQLNIDWNLITLSATSQSTGAMYLDVEHGDYGGGAIWLDGFEVTYG